MTTGKSPNKIKTKTTFRIALTIVCLFLGFLVALQMKNLMQLRALDLYGNNDVEALQDQIQSLAIANDELTQRNADLNANLQELIQAGNDDDAQLNFYRSETAKYATFAGLTDVQGVGAIINLDTTAEGAAVDASHLIVLVNSLKSNGVHAISINGQRVVSLTEISPTGSGANRSIIMNGTNITNPNGYEIRVIGEEAKLKNFYLIQSPVWERLQTQGVVVQIHYLQEVEIPGLPEDSPAFRQNLLEPVNPE